MDIAEIADLARVGVRLPISAGELWLLPEGAVLEPETNTVLVADVHLGKSDSFRRLGVPVPSGTNRVNLQRLSAIMHRYRPAHLVFLGDLIHDRLPGKHPVYENLATWRNEHLDVTMTLVIGNHDLKAGALPSVCGIDSVLPGTRMGPLSLLHEPSTATESGDIGHAVAGHIHPVVRLHAGGDSVRIRCFWAQPGLTVLPAFGEFTGGFPITAAREDSIYIINEQAVRRLPSAART